MNVDEVTRELAEIQDRLIALAVDDFAARFPLLKRRDELRERAAAFQTDWDAERDTADLVRELAALRSQLASLEGQKIDMVGQSGTATVSGGGAEGLGAMGLNIGMMAAQGGGTIQARIGRIKGVLLDRGVDPDEQ